MESQNVTQELTAQDIWRLFRETDHRFQETDHRFQETDRRFQESRTEHDRIIENNNRLIATHAQLLERMERGLEQLRKQVGRLSDDIGYFAESMVEPALVRLFTERGINLNRTFPRVTCRTPGLEMEIDILGVDGTYAVVVEVKTRLKQSDIDEHLGRLANFKMAFPEYQDKQVVGAVAGMQVPDNVGRYAYRQGLFVLAQTGETVELLNDAHFAPTVW